MTKKTEPLFEKLLRRFKEQASTLWKLGADINAIMLEYVVVALEHCHEELYWKESAWLMSKLLADSILQGEEETTLLIEDAPSLWILLESPKSLYVGEARGVLIVYRTHQEILIEAVRRLAGNVPALRHFEKAVSSLDPQSQWGVYLIDGEGLPLWCNGFTLSGSQLDEWSFSEDHRCPQGACRKEGKAIFPCEGCKEMLIWLTCWVGISLRMVRGDFQVSPETDEKPAYITEIGERPVPSSRTWEKKMLRVSHRMRVVSFDASLRPQRKTARGSWLADRQVVGADVADLSDLDDSAVIYVRQPESSHQRTFRAPRYVRMRGQSKEVKVQPHFQPITVATLKARREHGEPRRRRVVKASQFETSDGRESLCK